MYDFKDKIVLVTGAANGIGHSTAKLFASSGAKVIAIDVDKQIHNLKEEIKADTFLLDVSLEESWKEIYAFIMHKYRQLDILINNAAINFINNEMQDPENMSLETWNMLNKNNLNSVFLGCKFAIMLMKANKLDSAIINVASRSGKVGVPSLAAYAATKASIINYSKSVALYCSSKTYNIRCNAIIPAAILTRMWDHLIENQEDYENIAKTIPLKRLGKPGEVAKSIMFLASENAQFITGTELVIDGGILSGTTSSPSRKK